MSSVSKRFSLSKVLSSTNVFSPVKGVNALLFTIAIISLIVADSALADEERAFPVDDFHSLSVAKDVSVSVICGSAPMVIAKGHKDVLDDLDIDQSNGTLSISNDGEDPGIFSSKHLDISVITNKPIDDIQAIMGSQLQAHPCAISDKNLHVVASMGADVKIEGKVQYLNAEFSMGANFNEKESDLQIERANVDAAMGVNAFLCGAKYVSGEQAAGTLLNIGQDTQQNISTAMGAAVSKSGCS
ncbi:GIN domain-containing protein [Vibrio penaeicida]|nr:DUF2807 domain-containing protein [Vibrio penaeicida]RTZ20931.1 hypothetical protein EKN09_22015 [Vibrio penaeicida]